MCRNDKFHSVSYNTMKFVLYNKKNNRIRKNQQFNLLRVKRILQYVKRKNTEAKSVGVFCAFGHRCYFNPIVEVILYVRNL